VYGDTLSNPTVLIYSTGKGNKADTILTIPWINRVKANYYRITAVNTSLIEGAYSKVANIPIVVSTFPRAEDFEKDPSLYINLSSQARSDLSFADGIGNPGHALKFTGSWDWDGWTETNGQATSTNAWIDNLTHQTTATLYVDATNVTQGLILSFDLQQFYTWLWSPKTSWFRVMVNGTQIPDIKGVSDFNPVTSGEDEFVNHIFDLSAFKGSAFTIKLESSCKHFDMDRAIVDNIKIQKTYHNDAGILSIVEPLSASSTGLYNVKTVIRNFGNTNLKSANINWMVNGNIQTPFPWTGNLVPLVTIQFQSVIIHLQRLENMI